MSQSWTLACAPHVVGTLSEKDEDTGAQRLDLVCTVCQGTWRTYCYSGKPGKRILRFAILHVECAPDGVAGP